MRNKYFSSNFSMNVLKLATGTTIAQAIPIAISPILTRLYSPEDFGILSLFLSIVAIMGSIINAKYEIAIMLPKEDIEALGLVKLSVTISIIVSSILLLLVLILKSKLALVLNEPRIENWLLLVPVSVLFIGIYNALNLYNTREQKFKEVAQSSIAKSIGLGVTQIGVGVFNSSPIGLITGQIFSYISGNAVLLKILKTKKQKIWEIPMASMKTLMYKYIKFPKYSLPGSLLNTITLNSTNFFISAIFNTKTLGFYSLSSRLLGSPSMVIGNSISKVYYQEASVLRNSTNKIHGLFVSTLKKLTLISIPLFLILFFTVEPIFIFVFGEEWELGGTYAKILTPLMALRFISSSLSNTLVVLEKQEYTLLINVVLLSLTISVFSMCNVRNFEFMFTLQIFSGVLSMAYVLFLILYYKLCLKN